MVLARDARLKGPDVDQNITPVTDKDGFMILEPAGINQSGIWLQYKASFMLESHLEGPNKPLTLLICDYSSAGNTYDDMSRFRVWFTQLIDPEKFR